MHPTFRFVRILLIVAWCTGCQSTPAYTQSESSYPITPSSIQPSNLDLYEAMEASIRADSFPNTTSVLFFQHDTLMYEGYFGYGRQNLLNDTRSTAKSFTALAMGAAIAEGRLQETDLAFDILGDLAPFEHDLPLKREIQVADFLSMSSALDCNDNQSDSPGNENNMYPLHQWARWASDLPIMEGYSRDENGRGPFRYCTGGSLLLGQILERATGMNVEAYFKQALFDPLDITTWQWPRSPTGEFMTGGGLRLMSRDLGKLALLVLNEGIWEGKQVLPADWIRQATRQQVVANPQQQYGYQFWRRTWETACGPVNAPYMSGNGGNAVLILPELDAVAVITRQHYNNMDMHNQTIRLLETYILSTATCK